MSLKAYLEVCKVAYYAGEPIISDSQYDALEDACSEDMSVGTNKGRVKHLYRMYSLKKYYTDEKLPLMVLPGTEVVKTPKLDGASLALRYVEGVFDSAVTRGDGQYGEDVTHLFTADNLDKLGIPKEVSFSGAYQITGELVSPIYTPNSRNYAAGALNLKDPWEFWAKEVDFFAYGIRPYITDLYEEDIEFLKSHKFRVITDEETKYYPKDGEVYRMSINPLFEAQGYTSKHPRGAYAMKERSEGVKTILLRVDWETGKSGKVTPVAILDTVDIDGAKVSRATLNNPGFIKALDLHIGDAVMIERAGGIIPRIIKKAE